MTGPERLRTVVREIVYVIVDDPGNRIEHVRREYSDGSKDFLWKRNRANGLGGIRTDDLPLYNVGLLRSLAKDVAVVVCEGEKAAAALHAAGTPAVGTVTGASGTPSDDALRPLVGFEIYLWPDADPDDAEESRAFRGQKHMDRLAERLIALGVNPKLISWDGAPASGDAADFLATGGTREGIDTLLAAARSYAEGARATPKSEAPAQVEEILREAGLGRPVSRIEPQAIVEIGNRLIDALRGAHPLLISAVREVAKQRFKEGGVSSPAAILDAVMAESRSSPSDPAESQRPSCAELLAAVPEDIREAAESLLRSEPLKRLAKDIEILGHVGEPLNAKTLYVVLTSCLLRKPLGGEVVAASAAGKSHLVETELDLLPTEYVDRATSASQLALYYKTNDLRHCIVVRAERDLAAEKEFGSVAFRELMSHGRLERDVVVQDPATGEYGTRKVVVEGPVAFVETTTSAHRLDEDESRMVRIYSDESETQTKLVQQQIAREFQTSAADRERQRDRILQIWRAVHLILRNEALGEQPLSVVVPYAETIARLFPTRSLRTRRLLGQILTIVQVVALIRLRHHTVDEARGIRTLPADERDWREAHPIVCMVLRRALAEMDEGAASLLRQLRDKYRDGVEFTVADAMALGGVSDRTARKRIGTLARCGYVESDEEGHHGGRGKRAKYRLVPGTAEPDAEATLPMELPSQESFPGFSEGGAPGTSRSGGGEFDDPKPGKTRNKPGNPGFEDTKAASPSPGGGEIPKDRNPEAELRRADPASRAPSEGPDYATTDPEVFRDQARGLAGEAGLPLFEPREDGEPEEEAGA